MTTLSQHMNQDTRQVISALANDMRLAGSNDVSDTEHWLTEHVALVGIAEATRWYATCAVNRQYREDGQNIHPLDWKQGIVNARMAKHA